MERFPTDVKRLGTPIRRQGCFTDPEADFRGQKWAGLCPRT